MSELRDEVRGLRKSPRGFLKDINLKNITLRSRRNEHRTERKPKSELVQVDKNELSDDGTFFGGGSDTDDEFSDLISSAKRMECIDNLKIRTSSKSNLNTNQPYVTPKNDTYLDNKIESTLASRPQSTPKARKCNADIKSIKMCVENSAKKSIKPHKSLFSNNDNIRTCRSCKKPLKNSTERTIKSSIGSNISDSTYSKHFMPPCSSTKIFGIDPSITPIAGCSRLQSNSPMSGVKELRTPVLPKQNALYDSSKSKCYLDINDCNKNEENINDDDIPCTQPVSSIILRGVIAFIDVKMGNLKISDSLKSEVLSLGAEVEETFTKRVTHVIFRDGRLATYKKAKRLKIPLVSIVWLNECKKSLTILPTKGFVPPGLENYENKVNRKSDKDLFDVINTKRKNTGRKMKRMEKIIQKQIETKRKMRYGDHPVAPMDGVDPGTPLTPQNCNLGEFNLLKAFIDNLTSDVRDVINRSESPEEDIHVPVPVSLLRRFISPRKAKTDVKELQAKPRNVESKISERRKNLEGFLELPTNKAVDANKENNHSEEHLSERRSAPSELLTTSYKGVNGDKNNKQKKKNNKGNKKDMDNRCNDEQPLTQTSRKRQLLCLDQPVNEVLNDSIESNSFIPVINNPYELPDRPTKCRKGLENRLLSPNNKPNVIRKVGLRTGLKSVFENDNSENVSRRSSSQVFMKKNPRKKKVIPTIVCTGFINRENVNLIYSIVKKLGKYKMESNVSSATSHVVVERDNFRTINLLKGITRGCWIVSSEWVLASLEAGKWLLADKYESTSFSPAIRLNRLRRQEFGPEFGFDLFNECGTFYVNPHCSPPANDVKELISLSGGRVVGVSRAADIIVGGKPSLMYKSVHVTEKWVLDCISKLLVLDFDEYSLHELQLTSSH